MIYLFLAAFLLLLVQRLLAVFQYRRITDQYKEVRLRHTVFAVGQHKKWGMSSMAMIGCDEDLVVKEAYILKGFSILERFRPLSNVEGMTLSQLKSEYQSQRGMAALMQAIEFIEKGPPPDIDETPVESDDDTEV